MRSEDVYMAALEARQDEETERQSTLTASFKILKTTFILVKHFSPKSLDAPTTTNNLSKCLLSTRLLVLAPRYVFTSLESCKPVFDSLSQKWKLTQAIG